MADEQSVAQNIEATPEKIGIILGSAVVPVLFCFLSFTI